MPRQAMRFPPIYMTLGDSTRYEEHLIRAAITDQLVPAKENHGAARVGSIP